MELQSERHLPRPEWDRSSALSPANPFYTYRYAKAMEALGFEPWLLSTRDPQSSIPMCPGFVSRGRINTSLMIKSLPANLPPAFWDALLEFCGANRISRLEINTSASDPVVIPRLVGETQRRDRWEYVVPLQEGDLWGKLHENHRRRIRKAQKQQMSLAAVEGMSGCTVHAQLMSHSMDRRRLRGEDIESLVETRTVRALVEHGAGVLYQAQAHGQALSSILVLTAERGAYLHSSGTSAQGMETGANHFLQHEVCKVLRDKGMLVYNLGGADHPASGLATFKERFGAVVNQLQNVEAFVGHGWRASLSRLVRFAQQARKRAPAPEKSLAKEAAGQGGT